MLSIVIPTLNAERHLPRTLSALVNGAVRGLVREVIVTDGGSTDMTEAIADAAGAEFIRAPRGRGSQLAEGARHAKGPWLLFLHADTVLEGGWEEEVERFMERAGQGDVAAAFRFALDDLSPAARRLEMMVAWRCWLLALPYGDQGLLMSKRFYERLGGYAEIPLMEDVDIVRRIGRGRMHRLRARALTSAERYRGEGYLLRPLRNLSILTLYALNVPPRVLARLYG
ncbi:MAG: glycosyltransferase [Alphaproteobacteria bacterium]|nr:glycosyltransferase [Alphaproteobacteria bacterium]